MSTREKGEGDWAVQDWRWGGCNAGWIAPLYILSAHGLEQFGAFGGRRWACVGTGVGECCTLETVPFWDGARMKSKAASRPRTQELFYYKPL